MCVNLERFHRKDAANNMKEIKKAIEEDSDSHTHVYIYIYIYTHFVDAAATAIASFMNYKSSR